MSHDNTVILLGYYGGDETHCLSAWQSTNVELGIDMPEAISERIHALFEATVVQKTRTPQALLQMLAQSGHGTPFEKSVLHFQVRADIATHIHLLKHRIGVSINSESARYKELSDKWYIPADWHGTGWDETLDAHIQASHDLYHAAVTDLTPLLGRARAKESARYFLPYAKQLDFDICFNFRSFAHFQSLRNRPEAQKEIREIAQEMIRLVRGIPGEPFRYSLEAFGL